MKKNKGFTLIELLAIIVILAIIAVITVPIILNVIDNAKRGTAKDSAYGYKDAINKYYVAGMLEDESIKLSGEYNVVDGKLGEYDIPFSGTKPTSGYLTFENNALTSGCLTIDEYKVTFDKGEVTNVEVGECGPKVVYKCKRAELNTLHQEECTHNSKYCYTDGYYVGGSMGTTTITYGNSTITEGILRSGDAYDCDVNGDGTYNSQTERFYYVSDLYNTTTKEFDSNYAVLIYYNSTNQGEPDNTSSGMISYDASGNTKNGPRTAITNLPTTLQWNNVSLSNSNRSILNDYDEGTTDNGSSPLPTEFSYKKDVDGISVTLSARILTFQEVKEACGENGNLTSQRGLNTCNYMYENTIYSNNDIGIGMHWLETTYKPYSGQTWAIDASYQGVKPGTVSSSYNNGSDSVRGSVRPVIEVLKTDIEI